MCISWTDSVGTSTRHCTRHLPRILPGQIRRDDNVSPSTEDSSPTTTAAAPASRSPGPALGSSTGSQTTSRSNGNRSLVLGCAIAIPISVVLIAGIVGYLIWRRGKAARSAEMTQVHSKARVLVPRSAPVYEAPANGGREPNRHENGRAEVSGESAIKANYQEVRHMLSRYNMLLRLASWERGFMTRTMFPRPDTTCLPAIGLAN